MLPCCPYMNAASTRPATQPSRARASLTSHWSPQAPVATPTRSRRLDLTILAAIAALAADPRNVVVITSGATTAKLSAAFADVEGVWLAAENGVYLRPPRALAARCGLDAGAEWLCLYENLSFSWVKSVEQVRRRRRRWPHAGRCLRRMHLRSRAAVVSSPCLPSACIPGGGVRGAGQSGCMRAPAMAAVRARHAVSRGRVWWRRVRMKQSPHEGSRRQGNLSVGARATGARFTHTYTRLRIDPVRFLAECQSGLLRDLRRPRSHRAGLRVLQRAHAMVVCRDARHERGLELQVRPPLRMNELNPVAPLARALSQESGNRRAAAAQHPVAPLARSPHQPRPGCLESRRAARRRMLRALLRPAPAGMLRAAAALLRPVPAAMQARQTRPCATGRCRPQWSGKQCFLQPFVCGFASGRRLLPAEPMASDHGIR